MGHAKVLGAKPLRSQCFTDMQTDEIKRLTPYHDVNEIIVFFSEHLKNCLGKNLFGLYLTGSLSYGNFVPGRSDLDFQALVHAPLSQKELEAVKQLHDDIEDQYKQWAKRVECSYLPIALLHEILPPKPPRPWWGHGVFYAEAPYGNEWIINQYQLYNHGIALWGPDFKSLVTPIDIKEVQKACVRDLFREWEPKINDSQSLEDSHLQSYVVLNLCRILNTVLCGTVAPKHASAGYVKKAYPQWKDLVETAENWHYGIQMTENEKTIEFIKFAISEVNAKHLVD
jgi:hypothetical protein